MLRDDQDTHSLWDQRHWSRVWRHWLDHSSVFLPSSLCFPAAQLSLVLSCDTVHRALAVAVCRISLITCFPRDCQYWKTKQIKIF